MKILIQKDKVIRFQYISPSFFGHKFRYDLIHQDRLDSKSCKMIAKRYFVC